VRRPRPRGARRAPGGQPVVLGTQVGLRVAGGLGSFHQGRAQPGASFAGSPCALLPGALMVAGTDGYPGSHVRRRRESAHLRPNLREDRLRGP
jgi:hypothetical protein